MSMPEFPKLDHLTQEQALNSILTSIAMEEAALSHILNAEGEKIQYILSQKSVDVQKVIEVNESVASLLDRVIDLQIILKSKMRMTKEFYQTKHDKLGKPYHPC
jgi:hypothetical protein